jgi:ubiquinone/menaquinone biosynthesis C-methylase UbiE
MQLRIQRYGWNKASADYEACWRLQIAPAQSALLALMALKPGERVLDVACGTGLVTFAAAEAVGPPGEVVGTDISERMVTAAELQAQQRGLDNVRFTRADAERQEMPPAYFDAALCSLGLMYVPDPVAALERMYDSLKPGARAGVAVWGERRNCGWAGIFPVVDSRVESDVCPMFFQLGTGSVLETAMHSAGFREIRLVRIRTELQYATAQEALAAAFQGGPVALAYSRFDERTKMEAHADYLQSIAAFRVGEGYRIPGEFVVGRGQMG